MWWPWGRRPERHYPPSATVTINIDRHLVSVIIRNANVEVVHLDNSRTVLEHAAMSLAVRSDTPMRVEMKTLDMYDEPELPF